MSSHQGHLSSVHKPHPAFYKILPGSQQRIPYLCHVFTRYWLQVPKQPGYTESFATIVLEVDLTTQ